VQGPTGGLIVMDAGALAAEFEVAWHLYPRKVAKKDALKAYTKARAEAKSGEILAGIERYLRHKPSYADWAHMSSWLNKGRWGDEYEAPKPRRGFTDFTELTYDTAPIRAGHDARVEQRAKERWQSMPDDERSRLRTQARQQLQRRFPLMTLTEQMVDDMCVLELQR
jgi:hypothetical protein